MKTLLSQVLTLGVSFLFLNSAAAQTLDPGFPPAELYRPATVQAAVSQPDGKRLVLGNFARTDAGLNTPLVRYNADNTVDQSFAANVATLQGSFRNVRVLTSGKLLLIGSGPIVLNGLTRQSIMRLNADGSADASFDAGAASPATRVSAVQADGKILLGGTFTFFNGVAANRLVRLLPDGAVDPAFNGGNMLDDAVEEITLQPDGKILVGGSFNAPAGIARLLPTGALDNTFSSPLTTDARIGLIGVQPDGKILFSTSRSSFQFTSGIRGRIGRLLSNGAQDTNFLLDISGASGSQNPYDANEFSLQPDGKIVVGIGGGYGGQDSKGLIRIQPNGALDPTFTSPLTSRYPTAVTGMQRQANGQLLISGTGFWLTGHRGAALLLNANGSVDAAFNPLLLSRGSVSSMTLQPDRKLVVAGVFDEVNGVRANNVARYNIDGSIDAAFTGQAATNVEVRQVGLQPDGKLLLAGYSATTAAATAYPALIRLLPTGAVDNTFQCSAELVDRFVLQPDGRIITSDTYDVRRLLTTGQVDNTFQGSSDGPVYALVLQPDGKLLLGGYWSTFKGTLKRSIARLQSDGQLDPTFSSPLQTSFTSNVDELLLQPDGKILVGGHLLSFNQFNLFRLLPDGAVDNTFAVSNYEFVRGLALQPNGRVLVAAYNNGLQRVLPDGQPDLAFSATFDADVEDVLVQPDGKIVVGGYFGSVNGQRALGLARLTAPNVLRTATSVVNLPTEIWPNPAHEALQVKMDGTAHPLRLELLDVTGNVVRTQAATLPLVSLPVGDLTPGVYLLRVTYAAGQVVRRVMIR
ncbi:T9SS type A sorting domain-containing protein [Hymenobacter persicinus]|uniref:T9SS type A sorting domain-containing protein n=1 Tax=Hymenobacter persicinus TaxID=2025506 RepID=A0A4Q5LEN7_9BACT|nr:T9SS type A sorting domain-containing protein [Hymenobacter persicinus]RYU78953.1 T9SS type A sorting domain-containing protein [Hymenobacter persicinus]